jgi:S-DNA-T family DNA segregation ATPase FtsK/SpoIIIE
MPDGTSLPAVATGDEVVEGVVVDETPRPAPLRVVHAVVVVVRHEHTKTAGRHLGYIGAGVAIAARRVWDERTTARYGRMLRAAELTGNHEAALDWDERQAEFRRDRHQRRMDFLEFPLKVLIMLPKLALGMFAILAGLGVLLGIATGHAAEIAAPIRAVADVILWTWIAVSVTWELVIALAVMLGLAALWHTGRTSGSALPWMRTSADPDSDVTIDERTITQALDAMRIPQIRDYIKQGLPLQFLTPCRQEGRGTYAEIRLPKGVTAEKIARRRADFAAGLYRLPKEVWPSTGSEAAMLKVWIADKGALEEGAGPYPLLDDGYADFFRPVPFGRTLRGDPIGAPLAERNTIAGGMPGQGKSSAARIIMAGAALDPTAELRIWVPDTNFDFEAFKPRCSRYVMGAEDEFIEQIRDDLLELRAEVQTRGQLLIDHEVPAVTRELASAGVGLHPLVCLLEEAHVAITHPKYGKEISQLLIDIVKLGRKRGIHLIVSTQAPTKDSMPRDVTRNCSNGIAFAVGDHVANDALLGQGAYAAGHRATELIPGTDRGTCLVKGFSGERSEMVQAYFLSADKGSGNDQVTPIIDRSLAELARRGRAVPGTDTVRRAIETRDLLADLGEVLGSERVKLADLPALLRDHAPGWGPYRNMTRLQLRDQLEDKGVRVTNTGNVMRLDPADLRAVLARRESELHGCHLADMCSGDVSGGCC